MIHMQSLAGYFAGWAGGRPARRAIASTIEALAEVGIGFSELPESLDCGAPAPLNPETVTPFFVKSLRRPAPRSVSIVGSSHHSPPVTHRLYPGIRQHHTDSINHFYNLWMRNFKFLYRCIQVFN